MGIVLYYYLITILSSISLYVLSLRDIFFMLTNNGYKMNAERFSEFSDLIDDDSLSSKINKISLFIPFYNVAIALYMYSQINVKKFELFNGFGVMGLMEKLDEDEQNYFNEKPTFLRSLIVGWGFAKEFIEIEKMVEEEMKKLEDENVSKEEISESNVVSKTEEIIENTDMKSQSTEKTNLLNFKTKVLEQPDLESIDAIEEEKSKPKVKEKKL